MTYHGATSNKGTFASGVTWIPNSENVIKTTIISQSSSHNIVQYCYINGNLLKSVTYKNSSFPNVGQAYIGSYGPSTWQSVILSTGTTLHVAIEGCLSESEWVSFVYSVLGVNVATILDQMTTNYDCGGTISKKRDAVPLFSGFVFTIPDGPTGESSASLGSQFIGRAAGNDPVFLEQGVRVLTVGPADPDLIPGVIPEEIIVDGSAGDGAGGDGGDGLGEDAIIGIAVGGAVAAVIIAAIVIAIIAGIIAAIVFFKKRRNYSTKDQVEMTSVGSGKKRKGVDVFDPEDRTKSIGARVPSGYYPNQEIVHPNED